MIIDVSDFEPMPKELVDKELVDKSNESKKKIRGNLLAEVWILDR